MQNSFHTLFYIKKSKADKKGYANVYLRITIDGQRTEISINRKVPVEKWNGRA